MSDNDAARDMEQRALRNVRGALDRMEEAERQERAGLRRQVVGIVVAVIVALGGAWVALKIMAPPQAGHAVVLPGPGK